MRKLRNAGFLTLLSGQALSAAAEFFLESITKVTIALAFPGAGATVGLAVSNIGNALPRLALPAWAGRVADRSDRVRILRLALGVRICLAVLLVVCALVFASASPVFAVAIMVVSVATIAAAQFFNTARASVAQSIIPAEVRPEAAGASMFALTGVGTIAAASAPLLYSLTGAPGATLIVVVLEVVALLTLLRLPPLLGSHGPAADTPPAASAVDSSTPRTPLPQPVRMVFALACAYAFCTGVVNQALPLYVLRTRDMPVAHFGLVTGAFAAGGIIGALVAPHVFRVLGARWALVLPLITAAAGYVGFSLVPTVVAASLTMTAIGVCITAFQAAQGPVLQTYVPNAVMGATFGNLTGLSTASMIVGTASGAIVTWAISAQSPGAAGEDVYGWVIGTAGAILAVATLAVATGMRWKDSPGPAEAES